MEQMKLLLQTISHFTHSSQGAARQGSKNLKIIDVWCYHHRYLSHHHLKYAHWCVHDYISIPAMC